MSAFNHTITLLTSPLNENLWEVRSYNFKALSYLSPCGKCHNTLSELFYNFKRYLLFRTQINSPSSLRDRLGVVPHFSSGTVERAKRERA